MFSKKKISFFIILLVCFIDIMGIGLVYPMFSSMLFQSDSNLLPANTSDTLKGAYLGLLLAGMPLTHFFSAPLLGMLSDQKGRRKVLIPALLVGVLGYIIALIAVCRGSIILLFLSRIVVGISAGSAAVVQATLADLSNPVEKAKNFALLNMVFGLGFTVGPFIGGVLSDIHLGPIHGYALPFAVAGAVTFINFILAIFFFEETFTPKAESKISWTLGLTNIRKAFRVRNLKILFLGAFIGALGWSFYWEFTPVTWIMTYGFSTTMIGNLYAYGAAVYALSCGLLIRPIVDRYPSERVVCWGLTLCAISIGVLLIHSDKAWLWFYIPIQQFTIALFWPTAATLVSNSADESTQGETLGVLQSMEGLAFGLSPLIAGPLLGLSVLMPIIVGSSALFLSAWVYSFFVAEKKEELEKS
jgi:MFS transporter, DHA1 family, tetracycline resistance protein